MYRNQYEYSWSSRNTNFTDVGSYLQGTGGKRRGLDVFRLQLRVSLEMLVVLIVPAESFLLWIPRIRVGVLHGSACACVFQKLESRKGDSVTKASASTQSHEQPRSIVVSPCTHFPVMFLFCFRRCFWFQTYFVTNKAIQTQIHITTNSCQQHLTSLPADFPWTPLFAAKKESASSPKPDLTSSFT